MDSAPVVLMVLYIMKVIILAGIGVAMGNASEVIKSAADFIVKDNDSDGVSEAIEKFCF